VKGVGASLLLIVVLSLAVWVLIDSYSKRLERDETVVIVLLCTLLVLAGRWLWGRMPKMRKGGENEP
jgi:hypothetical protein